MRHYLTNTELKVQDYLILRQKVQHILTSYGIGEYELSIIEFISRNSDDRIITANEVYQELSLDRGWVYRSLRKLEDLGYISRSKTGWIHVGGNILIILKRIEIVFNKIHQS